MIYALRVKRAPGGVMRELVAFQDRRAYREVLDAEGPFTFTDVFSDSPWDCATGDFSPVRTALIVPGPDGRPLVKLS